MWFGCSVGYDKGVGGRVMIIIGVKDDFSTFIEFG